MNVIFWDCQTNRHGWVIRRTIRHLGGHRYESEVREITPAHPLGRVVGGEPSSFTLVDGVVRWESNGQLLMLDTIRDHAIDQVPGFDAARQAAARLAFLEVLSRSMQQNRPSGEELAEMRANFPAGSVLVNVFTGRQTRI